ncbi:MAG: response regulator, partial [Gemmatimonadetes bacterium]|nr:response regulator [Gemmatimonadota bacterium]
NALRESPYHLLSAYDGEEGFRLAVEHVPDLLVSDIDMPVMNGYEMCQRIKETESTRGIPILILSAAALASTSTAVSTPAPTTSSPNPSPTTNCSAVSK